MRQWAYYNEIEPYAAQWLRNLIKQGLIADGEVDERSIVDVRPDDLRGFTQCHFFAGIAGWSYAARLAGWPDDRPLWTGSCPCQPFSVAGKGEGTKDERHLWPEFFRLIDACRPPVVMGEQVAAAVGKHWLDGVFADLEGIGYACGAAVVPACAVDAPHRRDRLWFVADAAQQREHWSRDARQSRWAEFADGSHVGHAIGARLERHAGDGDDGHGPGRLDAQPGGSTASTGRGSDVEHAQSFGQREGRPEPIILGGGPATTGASVPCGDVADADITGSQQRQRDDQAARQRHPASATHQLGAWNDAEWIAGHDGKARRVKSGIRLLAHGVPARVGKLRAAGNAIVPQVAAEIIGAYMDAASLRRKDHAA